MTLWGPFSFKPPHPPTVTHFSPARPHLRILPKHLPTTRDHETWMPGGRAPHKTTTSTTPMYRNWANIGKLGSVPLISAMCALNSKGPVSLGFLAITWWQLQLWWSHDWLYSRAHQNLKYFIFVFFPPLFSLYSSFTSFQNKQTKTAKQTSKFP